MLALDAEIKNYCLSLINRYIDCQQLAFLCFFLLLASPLIEIVAVNGTSTTDTEMNLLSGFKSCTFYLYFQTRLIRTFYRSYGHVRKIVSFSMCTHRRKSKNQTDLLNLLLWFDCLGGLTVSTLGVGFGGPGSIMQDQM